MRMRALSTSDRPTWTRGAPGSGEPGYVIPDEIWENADRTRTVTVAGKPSIDVPVGTLASIWKQAGIKKP